MISPGDKVTAAVYLADGSTFVVRTCCGATSATLHISSTVSVWLDSWVLDCTEHDEGVTWIRGWPDLDSDDVKTLLAAFALAGGEEHSQLFGYDYDDDDYGYLYSRDIYYEDWFEPQGLVR